MYYARSLSFLPSPFPSPSSSTQGYLVWRERLGRLYWILHFSMLMLVWQRPRWFLTQMNLRSTACGVQGQNKQTKTSETNKEKNTTNQSLGWTKATGRVLQFRPHRSLASPLKGGACAQSLPSPGAGKVLWMQSLAIYIPIKAGPVEMPFSLTDAIVFSWVDPQKEQVWTRNS